LRQLIDVDRHADELTWDTHFVDSAAAHAPEILDERDRAIAEADFRLAMALPIGAIMTALAYRASPWLLILLVIPAWMFFLGGELRGEADEIILEAVVRGTIDWSALDYLDDARIHYRPRTQISAPS
jgi:hypothetical protein